MDLNVSWEIVQLWITIVTVILLVTNELISPYLGKSMLYINQKRLRNITYLFIIIFLIMFSLTIYLRFLA